MPDAKDIAARRRKAMLAAAARFSERRGPDAAADAAADAGGATAEPSAAFAIPPETSSRKSRFEARKAIIAEAVELRRRGELPSFIERKIGPTLDWLSLAPDEAARKAGLPVARIVDSVDPAAEPSGYGTGFLVHPQILMTNHHVFPDVASAIGAGANFGFEADSTGRIARGLTYAITPESFYVSDEALDFALVGVAPQAVSGEPIERWNTIIPNGAIGKILVGQPVNIIQYPDGAAKKYATTDNAVIDILDSGFLHYRADTLGGSSGSPVFSEAWELVGLHHAGVPEVRDGKIMTVDGQEWSEEMGDDAINWIANEGIRISAIVKALASVKPADRREADMLHALLANSSDPSDDIINVMAGKTAAPETKGGEMPASQIFSSAAMEAAMANGITMNFTGPVTININPATGAVQLAEPPEVAEEKSLRFDPDYANRKGYDPAFLRDDLVVPMPQVAQARMTEMVQEGGKVRVLPYHHYSLAMNGHRKLPMWAASNADYSPERRPPGSRASFGQDKWITDRRLPAEIQMLEADIYGPAHQIDLGHIVRRVDSAWGDSADEVEFANSDTFHLTNCTPQHEAFNRATPSSKKYGKREGIWGGFEMYTQSQLEAGDTRCCILAGPVLAADDPEYDFGHGKVQVPNDFWKVVVVADRSTGAPKLRAFGFILSQKDLIDQFGIEFAAGRFARYAKPLIEITQRSGVEFDQLLLDADQSAAFINVPGG